MTDQEKKQKEILRNLANELDQLSRQRHTKKDEDYTIDQAISELSKLDAIPTSEQLDEKEVAGLLEKPPLINGIEAWNLDYYNILHLRRAICQAYKEGKLRKE